MNPRAGSIQASTPGDRRSQRISRNDCSKDIHKAHNVRPSIFQDVVGPQVTSLVQGLEYLRLCIERVSQRIDADDFSESLDIHGVAPFQHLDVHGADACPSDSAEPGIA